MAPIALKEKKRKNIDLPPDTLRKLSIMAAAQGTSVKAFIENILEKKAQTLDLKVYLNPSPSDDPYFDNPDNLAEVERRVKQHKEGKTKISVTLKSTEDIKNFIDNL